MYPIPEILTAWGAILEEELGPMDPHERTQVILRNSNVTFAVHRTVLWKEVRASSPPLLPLKQPDTHHTGTVLHGGLVYHCL
jgi:hypothetical protein